MNALAARTTRFTLFAPGQANPKRGLKDHQYAVAFIRQFPIGSVLSADRFDDWLVEAGMLAAVPRHLSKNSVEWKAHLQDRHNAKMRLNRGGNHPRLLDENLTPFSLDSVGQGTFEVRSPQAAVINSELPRKVENVANTKRRRLKRLMQSIDWATIPERDKLRAEMIVLDIDEFVQLLTMKADQIEYKFKQLENRIKAEVDAGTLQPRNGGIRQLISPDANNGGSGDED
jgi:hypothetical protein